MVFLFCFVFSFLFYKIGEQEGRTSLAQRGRVAEWEGGGDGERR
jgi:hypothetical protein